MYEYSVNPFEDPENNSGGGGGKFLRNLNFAEGVGGQRGPDFPPPMCKIKISLNLHYKISS